MRSVLVLSLALLVLTLLLEGASFIAPKPIPRHAGADGALSVVAVGKGPMLPNAKLPGGTQDLNDAMLIGNLTLKFPGSPRGLRIGVMGPGFSFRQHARLDLAYDPGAAGTLASLIRRQQVGSILALSNFGRLKPATPETELRLERLKQLLAELGSDALPLDSERSSWAMITIRLESGWVKLAESWSDSIGVVTSFTVSPDLSLYENFQGDRKIDAPLSTVNVELDRELPNASIVEGIVQRDRWASVRGLSQAALSVRARTKETPARIVWEDVLLGKSTRLLAQLAVRGGANEDRIPVRVLINGETVDETEHPFETLRGWTQWELDLSTWDGQVVTLEIQVDSSTSSNGSLLFGLPTLTYEPLP